ncbi:hypothetical protein [Wukongibacter sp. M2B1]|uniref:hypothetical protein n=1 Tax=Wukongibacter sp. M2B1 TaxID=3088895 RepID=UPI003D7923DA
MKILDNLIMDFSFPGTFKAAAKKEVEILQCFLSEEKQLVFLQLESNLYPDANSEITGVNEEIKEIVLKNVILKTKEKLLDLNYETNKDEIFYWFSPRTKEEIIKIIENKYYSYKCIILEKGKNIKEYDYLLHITEHFEYDEYDECRALIVDERVDNSFEIDVKPKIEKLFESIME